MRGLFSVARFLEEEAPESTTDPERVDSVVLLVQLLLLGCALIVGRVLQKFNVQWIGSAGSALVLGLLAGLIARATGMGSEYLDKIAFSGDIFFFVMLPTIMFDAGYAMDIKPFFNNLGAICAYAFLGTTISTFAIGLTMWAGGLWGLCYEMSLLKNLTFGAIVSATDPVTVLAVFQQLGAQEDLYAIVFGESVLNDAVAMVLYNTISAFLEPGVNVNTASIFKGIGMFVGIFLASTLIGLAVGFIAALIFRTQYFNSNGSTVETGMVVVFAFLSYIVADILGMSGIVSILFCAMMMAGYVKPNLSETAEHRVHSLFAVMGGLFELFVFVYIGTSLFAEKQAWNTWTYTLICLFALAHSRLFNILPCSWAVNFLRPPELRVGPKMQFMLWWSGLRGAMAFALAVKAAQAYGEDGQVMMTCTFFLILITVIVNGGASPWLLERLALRSQDQGAASSGAVEMSGGSMYELAHPVANHNRKVKPMDSIRQMNNRKLHESLSRLDNKFLSRLLIHPEARREQGSSTVRTVSSGSALYCNAFDEASEDGSDTATLLATPKQ